jgi:hypothetical protein
MEPSGGLFYCPQKFCINAKRLLSSKEIEENKHLIQLSRRSEEVEE